MEQANKLNDAVEAFNDLAKMIGSTKRQINHLEELLN